MVTAGSTIATIPSTMPSTPRNAIAHQLRVKVATKRWVKAILASPSPLNGYKRRRLAVDPGQMRILCDRQLHEHSRGALWASVGVRNHARGEARQDDVV